MRLFICILIGLFLGAQTTAIAWADTPDAPTAKEEQYPIIDSGTATLNINRTDAATDAITTANMLTRSTTYIPMVNTHPAEWPAFSQSVDESKDFAVERNRTVTRLIQLSENGGQAGPEFDCGQSGRVEVFVFGASGEPNRLGDIAVQVIHTDNSGNQRKEIRWTRVDGSKRGSVQFRLDEYAEVRILEDDSGRLVSSESIKVTGKPLHVNNQWLADAGYCQESQSCWTMRHENSCQGQLSWNIVFKQR